MAHRDVSRAALLCHRSLKLAFEHTASAPKHGCFNVLRLHANCSSNTPNSAGPPSTLGASDLKGGNPVIKRYRELIADGTLSEDPSQLAVVQRMALLHDNVLRYRDQMVEYHERLNQYQARRQERLQQLHREQKQSQAAQPGVMPPAADAPTRPGWFSNLWPGSGAGKSLAQPQLSAAQQARLLAAQREAVVSKELGPPPVPPPVPKGVYLHGSVGSGKSLIMDLLFEVLDHPASGPGRRQGLQRRMHFNAAMLEVHSRLHHIDKRRSEELAQADAQRQARHDKQVREQQRHHQLAVGGGAAANAASSTLSSLQTEDDAAADAAAEQDERECVESAAAVEAEELTEQVADPPIAHSGIFRYWDSGVQRQREAKLAFLAVRRHLRLARTSGHSKEALARANASNLVEMASSFIHGAEAPATAGGPHAGRVAAVLCFDELQVTDVFTAAALKGLFEQLRRQGCVVVLTSNRAPGDLQRHGLHEHMFGHFIETLHNACDVVELSSKHDYRRLLLQGCVGHVAPIALAAAAATSGTLQPAQTYLTPLSEASKAQLQGVWDQLTAVAGATASAVALGTTPANAAQVPIMAQPKFIKVMFGRSLAVHRSAGGVAWFNFEELCARPLGAADYIAIAGSFHTVLLDGVPAMSMQVRDQARRFITLVDELYNARCVLVCSAAVPPDQLFAGADADEPIFDLEQLQFEGAVEGARLRRDIGADGGVAPVGSGATASAAIKATLGGMDEKFAFHRAVSRLYEMQSAAYLSRCRAVRASASDDTLAHGLHTI